MFFSILYLVQMVSLTFQRKCPEVQPVYDRRLLSLKTQQLLHRERLYTAVNSCTVYASFVRHLLHSFFFFALIKEAPVFRIYIVFGREEGGAPLLGPTMQCGVNPRKLTSPTFSSTVQTSPTFPSWRISALESQCAAQNQSWSVNVGILFYFRTFVVCDI